MADEFNQTSISSSSGSKMWLWFIIGIIVVVLVIGGLSLIKIRSVESNYLLNNSCNGTYYPNGTLCGGSNINQSNTPYFCEHKAPFKMHIKYLLKKSPSGGIPIPSLDKTATGYIEYGEIWIKQDNSKNIKYVNKAGYIYVNGAEKITNIMPTSMPDTKFADLTSIVSYYFYGQTNPKTFLDLAISGQSLTCLDRSEETSISQDHVGGYYGLTPVVDIYGYGYSNKEDSEGNLIQLVDAATKTSKGGFECYSESIFDNFEKTKIIGEECYSKQHCANIYQRAITQDEKGTGTSELQIIEVSYREFPDSIFAHPQASDCVPLAEATLRNSKEIQLSTIGIDNAEFLVNAKKYFDAI